MNYEHICAYDTRYATVCRVGAGDGMWYVSLGNWPESSDAVSRLRSNHRQMSGPGSPELLLTRSLARSLRSWQLRRIFRSAEIWDCQHKYLLRLSHHPYWAGRERMTYKSTKWCYVIWSGILFFFTIWIDVECQKWIPNTSLTKQIKLSNFSNFIRFKTDTEGICWHQGWHPSEQWE